MKRTTLITFSLAFLLFACGSLNTKMTGSWKSPDLGTDKTYKSVFISVMGPSIQSKNMLESELALRASSRGITTYKSTEVFGNKFTQTTPSKEEVLKIIRATGAESIFTVALKDKETTTRYVPGSTGYYSPMGYGYYGNFYGYYSGFYPMAYDPGYYQEDKIYYVETHLYDSETEELMWSAQSKTYNPSNSEDFVRGYTQALADKLIKDGIIKGSN